MVLKMGSPVGTSGPFVVYGCLTGCSVYQATLDAAAALHIVLPLAVGLRLSRRLARLAAFWAWARDALAAGARPRASVGLIWCFWGDSAHSGILRQSRIS